MRKREYELTEETEIREILDRGKIIHLGLCDGDWPYVLPMNYGYIYENGKLVFYLHGAREGYKYDLIRKNARVSFSIECDATPFEGRTACQYGMAYSSILGKGTAQIVESPAEKMAALENLMKVQTGKEFEFNEKLVSIVNVIRVEAVEFNAKKRPIPGNHPEKQ